MKPLRATQLNVRVLPEISQRLAALQRDLARQRGHNVSQAEAVAWAVVLATPAFKRSQQESAE